MRVVVHSVRFPDLEQGPPEDPAVTAQLVEIYAGPSDGPGEERFQEVVSTPAALSRMLADQDVIVGRHWLFVDHFDAGRVEHFLRKLIQNIEGASWNEVAATLGRLAQHELED
ncbi:Imm8 family immunity protein [Micromonospora sp. NPDC000668]|uniref:Imm8 family immunity protein n=1 Tax=Micromonospora sp. NPDC000668 TaxID=3364219 RepID=UPI0036B80EBD